MHLNIGHLNVNSVRNKIVAAEELWRNKMFFLKQNWMTHF